MNKERRKLEDYFKLFQQKETKFYYGEYDYSNLFNNQVLLNQILLEKSNLVIQNLLKFGSLDENQKKIISQIIFECEPTSSLSAYTKQLNNKLVINLSTGLIRFLTLLNAITISFSDGFENLLTTKNKSEKEFDDLYIQFGQMLFDCFNLFHDRTNIYRHILIKVPIQKKGFFTFFKNKYPKELEPVVSSTNHQLEFIILHEVAHILYPDYDEFQCDYFALRFSRKIWRNVSYHTVVCEYLQLVLFMYYDFLEKYFESQENLIKLWNNKDKEHLKFKINSFNHIRALERFKRILSSSYKVSEHTKVLIRYANQLFDYTFDAILYKDLELIHFFNVTNIEKQLRIQKFLHNKFDFDYDKETAEMYKKMVNSSIHTTDTEFWTEYHKLGSPFGLFFIGNSFTDLEVIKANQLRLSKMVFLFYNAVIEKFGELNKEKAINEIKKHFVIFKKT